MQKTTLALILCSGLAGAILLTAHPANAAEILTQATDSVASVTTVQNLHLSLVESRQRSNPIKDQLVCGCAVCTSTVNLLQGKLPL